MEKILINKSIVLKRRNGGFNVWVGVFCWKDGRMGGWRESLPGFHLHAKIRAPEYSRLTTKKIPAGR